MKGATEAVQPPLAVCTPFVALLRRPTLVADFPTRGSTKIEPSTRPYLCA